MARNHWKYATLGLGGLVGAGIIFYMVIFVIPVLTAATNNQPNTLEGVPDEWAVYTWNTGQSEAIYDSWAADCDISIVKDGSPDHPVNLAISLSCDGDETGMSYRIQQSDNMGGEGKTFITDPADFEFTQPEADSCNMSFSYAPDRWDEGVEEIHLTLICDKQDVS